MLVDPYIPALPDIPAEVGVLVPHRSLKTDARVQSYKVVTVGLPHRTSRVLHITFNASCHGVHSISTEYSRKNKHRLLLFRVRGLFLYL